MKKSRKATTLAPPPRCSGCGNLTTLCACQPVSDPQETITMGPGRAAYTTNAPSPEEAGPNFKKILLEFVKDIDATGGVFRKGFRSAYEGTETCAPVGAKDWTDLGETYLKACKALRRRPHVEKED